MKVASFDIFDTCFVRACGRPSDLFDILAFKILGVNSAESLILEFSNIRKAGEREARKNKSGEEVTLHEIYEHCDFSSITDIANSQIAREEMLTEKALLVPVLEIKEKIEFFREKGYEILYISDMYLPKSFLLNLLKEHDFWKSDDHIFVSSEEGVTKESGNLYIKIKEELKLDFKNWIHFGDNVISDCKIPKKLGIKTDVIKHKLSFYEEWFVKQGSYTTFPVNDISAYICKAVRLTLPKNIHTAFASDLIAPLFVAFVYDIFRDAQERGISKLFFLARDGYVLYKIATIIQPLFPLIEINYIYASRLALYFCGINEINYENLMYIIDDQKGLYSISDDLRTILPDYICEELNKVYPGLDSMVMSERNIKAFLTDEKVSSILNKYHSSQQELAFKYFIQSGMGTSNNSNCAIIDLRGSRRCQWALNRILESHGVNPVFGYYLEVTSPRQSIKDAGGYFAWIYDEQCLGNKNLSSILEIQDLLEEYYAVSIENKTVSFQEKDGKIVPVYEEKEINSENVSVSNLHIEAIKKYAELFVSTYIYNKINLLRILNIKLLGDLSYNPNYNYLIPCSIIKQRNENIIEKITIQKILTKSLPKWRNGCIKYTFRGISDIILPFSVKLTKLLRRINAKMQKKF